MRIRSLRQYLEIQLEQELSTLDADAKRGVSNWIQDDEGVDLVDFMGAIAQVDVEIYWRIQQLESCLSEFRRLNHLAEKFQAIRAFSLVVKDLIKN